MAAINREFVEADALVHLVNSEGGSEHTLCGDAFDLASDEAGYAWEPAKTRKVSCPRCAGIIRLCRNVRIA
jgi:hypothetical protein